MIFSCLNDFDFKLAPCFHNSKPVLTWWSLLPAQLRAGLDRGTGGALWYFGFVVEFWNCLWPLLTEWGRNLRMKILCSDKGTDNALFPFASEWMGHCRVQITPNSGFCCSGHVQHLPLKNNSLLEGINHTWRDLKGERCLFGVEMGFIASEKGLSHQGHSWEAVWACGCYPTAGKIVCGSSDAFLKGMILLLFGRKPKNCQIQRKCFKSLSALNWGNVSMELFSFV